MLVQALLGWVLIAGLATDWRRLPPRALSVFRVAPPPPPPPMAAPRLSEPRRRAVLQSPAPSRATPVVAPPPVIPLPVLATVLAASQPSTGAGAIGVGASGSGAGGRGVGGEGSGGSATTPQQVRGEIRDADYPAKAAREDRSGGVDIRYLVGANGRIARCEVVRSSGSTDLDETACRLAQARFRFEPATDADGRRIAAWVDDGVEWVNHAPPSTP